MILVIWQIAGLLTGKLILIKVVQFMIFLKGMSGNMNNLEDVINYMSTASF
jgi:hypothetical protein